MRRERRQPQQSARHPREDATGTNYAFRRSRTLIGSLHSDVRAASENRGLLRSPRLREHDLRKHRRKLGLWFLCTVGVMLVLGYLLSNYSQTVDRVRIVDLPAVAQSDLQDYQELANKYLDENPFERFRFALNEGRFIQFMSHEAPEIAEASIDQTEQLMSSEVILRLRRPVAMWNSGTKHFFVGSDGVAFEHTVLPRPSVTIIDKSANTELGSMAASAKMLRFIGRVVALVDASGEVKVESIQLPMNSTRQADIKLVGKPYPIKTYLDRDPAGQATDVVNAVTYFNNKGITPKYVDVRVPSKAFYQ